jgi:hydroxylamine reductase
MGMFCYQCQEALKNQGCTVQGVCGKNDQVANLQDLLIHLLKGISFWAVKAREAGLSDDEVDLFVAEALFSTITNVNFDPERFNKLIKKAFRMREKAQVLYQGASKNAKSDASVLPDAATWFSGNEADYAKKGGSVGVLLEANPDIRSLKELLVYGLKGIAAYADHAYVLNKQNNAILAFLQKGLASTLDPKLNVNDYVGLVLETGKYGVDVMALLDGANTAAYGNQEVTEVSTGTKQGPAILVSGHDLLDLEEILKQTEGQGINVYTHGEMLPANAYPGLKKFKHLVGNYGTAWYNQQKEFDEFNGAIVMTTNCMQKPKDTYKDRIFTTGLAGWPGVEHIANRKPGGEKDFSSVINKALVLGGLEEKPGKKITIGFAQNTLSSVAGKIMDAVKAGAITRFVVMGGCDGRHKEREYFTEVANKLPKSTVILTAGCAKYRYNMLDLGDIGGIPRVVDAGQCNDSYSLAVIALKLKDAFGLKDVNDLPLSFDLAWYEQKAVIVLLALLFLGFKSIRLGPTLPAFLSPNVVDVLVKNFNIMPTKTADEDVAAMVAAK